MKAARRLMKDSMLNSTLGTLPKFYWLASDGWGKQVWPLSEFFRFALLFVKKYKFAKRAKQCPLFGKTLFFLFLQVTSLSRTLDGLFELTQHPKGPLLLALLPELQKYKDTIR